MIWTLANACTMLRVVLLPLLMFLVWADRFLAGFFLLSFMGISDVLDGWIARRTNTASRLGAVLDVCADCLLVFSVQVFLVITAVWPVYILVLSTSAILSFCLRLHVNGVPKKPRIGKYTGAVLVVFFLCMTLCRGIQPGLWEKADRFLYPALAVFLSAVIVENLAGLGITKQGQHKTRRRFVKRAGSQCDTGRADDNAA